MFISLKERFYVDMNKIGNKYQRSVRKDTKNVKISKQSCF